MSIKYIDVMDTSFCTGVDAIFNNSVNKAVILPLAEAAKESGISNFEISLPHRFIQQLKKLNENPFEFIKEFRWAVGEEANLQIRVNGLNTVFNKPVSSALHKLFIKLCLQNGVTTVAPYSILNDMRNIDLISYLSKENLLLNEPTITLMNESESKIFNTAYYKNLIIKMLDLGIEFDSLLFRDDWGVTSPAQIYEIVAIAKEILGKESFIRVSTRDRAGFGVSFYLAALEAGADGLDLASQPFSGGLSTPDMLTMIQITKGMGYNFGDLKEEALIEYQKYLKEQLIKYIGINLNREVNTLNYYNPLLLDNIDIDLKMVNEVIFAGGYANSTREISEIYYKQIKLNKKFGKWSKIDKSFALLLLGYLGKTPFVPDPDLVEIAEEQSGKKFITKNPLEIADKEFERLEKNIINEEEFLCYLMKQ